MASFKLSLLTLALLARSVLSSQSGSQIVNYFTNAMAVGRADPIVSSNEVSNHVHLVFGGGGFDQGMTQFQALHAKCTANNIVGDKSNYWMPSLFFSAPNGTFCQVQASDFKVYYAFEQTSDDMVPFLPGLHLVAGDALARVPPGPPGSSGHNIDPAQGVVIPYEIQCVGSQPTFTDQYCTDYDGLRTNIYFPQCYNPAAGLTNYTDNWAYASSAGSSDGKICPPGWLHHPQMNLEVYWNVHAFDGQWTPGAGHIPWVFAHGDPTGAGAHADFVAGWDESTLASAIQSCDSPASYGNGAFSDCFPDQKVQSADGYGCTVASPVDEKIWGLLPALPGCNPIQNGPGRATIHTGCGATTTIGARQTQYTDFTESLGWEYYGCYTDAFGFRALQGGGGTCNTIQDCINMCSSQGFTMAGVEYSHECYCANSMTTGSGNGVPSGMCSWPCQGDSTQVCGGPNLLNVYRKCNGVCQNNSGPVAAPQTMKRRNAGRFVD